ncbi:MAG: methylated-DNA--[protein]-cysteine S-methyltransferase [Bacteroidales bacterium]|nr:methylated-DNA--[protein]-cysteine S-methyltransferase [Bacteroidales bacterium]
MTYAQKYITPPALDNLIMESDGENLTGLHFCNEKYSPSFTFFLDSNIPIFDETRHWLDIYFSGKEPNFLPKFTIKNATTFRMEVLRLLEEIPFGKTITYSALAAQIAQKHNIKKMSAQAVGGAVGWNPICIIIPCHRVIGVGGKIVGYGGGVQNKIKLLELEKKTK